MYYTLFLFCFVWCLSKASNNVSVQYNGRLLPDIMLFYPMLLPLGNPFKYHEKVLSLKSTMPSKRFDIFPPDRGMLRKSRISSDFSFKTNVTAEK